MKKEKHVFYCGLKGEKKRDVRAAILESRRNRQKQMQFYLDKFITPQRMMIAMADKVLKNEIPIDIYIRDNERLSKYLMECLIKGGKNYARKMVQRH